VSCPPSIVAARAANAQQACLVRSVHNADDPDHAVVDHDVDNTNLAGACGADARLADITLDGVIAQHVHTFGHEPQTLCRPLGFCQKRNVMNRFSINRSAALLATLMVTCLMNAVTYAQTSATAPATAAKPVPAKPEPRRAVEKAKASFCKPEIKGTPVKVKLTTSMGALTLELDAEKAPISVENFVKYVQSGHYAGTIFHRVIDGFMIQGGGFTKDMQQKPTNAQIKNESTNGLKNDIYTVAMARTGVRDSATSQFFINVKGNDFLNYSGENPQGWGYAVFGKVVEGSEIVDKMRTVKTTNAGPHQNVPVEPIVIEKAECIQ